MNSKAKENSMLEKIRATEDRGMATVEYALVTLAAAAFAGLLIAIIRSEGVRNALAELVSGALGGS